MHILQVTDCHLLSDPGAEIHGTDTYKSLRAILRAAKALTQPPALVLATGDLSENGSPGSYTRLRELFLESRLPVHVIAGNHDSAPGMRRFLVGGPIVMEPYVDIAPWRIVFLDSTVAGEPHGYVAASELTRLAETLAADRQRPVLVCLHHSPTRPCPTPGCHLQNEDELIDVLDAHANARAVLAGHSHLMLERRIKHAALLTTPATSSQCAHAQLGEPVDHEDFWASHEFDAGRHGFRMMTLHPDGQFDTEVHWVRHEDAV